MRTRLAGLVAVICGLTAVPAAAHADSLTPLDPLFRHLSPSVALLPDGRVLANGTQNAPASDVAEIYDPATSRWASAVELRGALATLGDGRVLAASTSPVVYDPRTNASSPAALGAGLPAANLPPGVRGVTLRDGTAFVTSGSTNGDVNGGGYRYHPAEGPFFWTITTDPFKRTDSTTTLLPDGSVLVAGGSAPTGTLSSASLYQPSATFKDDVWVTTSSMTSRRTAHAATLLADGRVLVVGGFIPGETGGFLATAEIYTPATGQWAPVRSMGYERANATATLLPNGKVLVAGGKDQSGALRSTEVYDPATNTWTAAPDMRDPHDGGAAVLLRSGQVLIVGGEAGYKTGARAELYTPDPAAGGPGSGVPGTGGGAGGPGAGTGGAGTKTPALAGAGGAGTAPVLSAPSLSASRFRAASRGATIARTPTGATITYTNSMVSRTTFTIQRVTKGRRKGSRCVAPSKARRGARRCTLLKTVGSASHADVAGRNKVRFSGRVRGKRLSAGTYRLVLVAKSPTGVKSKPRTLTFTIVH